MKEIFDLILNLLKDALKEFGIVEKIKKRARRMGPAWKAQGVAYFLAPGIILGVGITYGGGVGIDFGKGFAISELKTELVQGAPFPKGGVLLIAEPKSSNYEIPVTPTPSKIWSSLDAEQAKKNAEIGHLRLNGSVLHIHTPFFAVKDEPVLVLVEGALDPQKGMSGPQIEVLGQTESIENWRLTSRNSSSVVSAVLINCFFALGLGLATAAAPINGDKNNTGQEGTEPDEEGIIKGDSIEC
jgi:hypothetical protein